MKALCAFLLVSIINPAWLELALLNGLAVGLALHVYAGEAQRSSAKNRRIRAKSRRQLPALSFASCHSSN